MSSIPEPALLPDEWTFTQVPTAGTEIQCPRCGRWSRSEEWEADKFERPLACAQWYLICPLCPPGADRVFGAFDDYEQPVPVRTAASPPSGGRGDLAASSSDGVE
jgi:hypothetical protein